MGNLSERLRYLFTTKAGARRLLSVLPALMATVGTVAQIWIWLDGDESRSATIVIVVAVVVTAGALGLATPPRRVVGILETPYKTTVRISVRDLLDPCDSTTVVAFGVSDLVGAEFPADLDPRTVLAQALPEIDLGHNPGGDAKGGLARRFWADSGVAIGQPLPVGHCVQLDRHGGGRFVIVVFARIDEWRTETHPGELMEALARIWTVLAELRPTLVRVPVFGSGFGGARLPRAALISLLVTSFRFALERGPICDTLEICIRDQDFDPADLLAAERVFPTLGFK